MPTDGPRLDIQAVATVLPVSYTNQSGGPAALIFAERYLGTPYVWGGGDANGPTVGLVVPPGVKGFDCSGLEERAYTEVGVTLLHSTFLTFRIAPVPIGSAWLPGDLGYMEGSDPGPHGEPGHTGMFKGIGRVEGAQRHLFVPDPMGGCVFLNAPYTGAVGGVRYDVFPETLIVAHTRPMNLLPHPPTPLPQATPSKIPPTMAQLHQTHLVALPNPGEARIATHNSWALFYFGTDGRFHPQVGGKPQGVTLYANAAYKTKRPPDVK